ncbi:MAG: hypothetical protein H0X63_11865, partial [Flavobacteriales bacterium]|nr:hypothetical protein [Flavobacteriales bacterium]
MKTKIAVFGILLATQLGFAQDGVSSASLSLLQSNGLNSYNERGVLNERMVIVEDFMNYHKHDISLAKQADITLQMEYNNELAAIEES